MALSFIRKEKTMNKVLSFLNRNGSTILTCIGAIGVIATSVMAVKATPKAIKMIESDSMDNHDSDPYAYTKKEAIKSAWKCYIPAVVTGASTIACIFGANVLNKHYQASLMSAYALLDHSYKEYKEKADELMGEEFDHKVKEEIAKDKYEEYEKTDSSEKLLFMDFATLQYFEATMDSVLQKVTMDDGLECYIITTPFA